MKKIKLPGIIVLMAIILFSFFGCKDDSKEDPTIRTSGTEITLSFGKATVKSNDKFLDAEWLSTVNDVKDAINRGYNKDMDNLSAANKSMFEWVFEEDKNVEIILSKSATIECEVKADGKLYLKNSILNTVDIQTAVWAMNDGVTYP